MSLKLKKYLLNSVFFVVNLLLYGCSGGMPKDGDLIDNFEKNRKYFDEIKSYLCTQPEKMTVMMSPEWSAPKASTQAKNYLYNIFKKIGVQGVHYDGNCSFRLLIWSTGVGGGGDYKEYSYRPNEHWKGRLISSPIDSVDFESKDILFLSREIQNGWYIGFQHWP